MGLTVGADDYPPQAFSPRELAACIRATLRRGRGGELDAPSLFTLQRLAHCPARQSMFKQDMTLFQRAYWCSPFRREIRMDSRCQASP